MERAGELHRRFAADRDPALQAELVDRYQGLARSLAARAATPSDDLDDLVQVAMLGILHALDRYDPDRGVEFTTFAWATIQGELKRHHRDKGWGVRVPRRLQEAYLRVAAAVDDLRHELGRQPSLSEIAAYTGDDEETVIEAIEVRAARRPASLDLRFDDARDSAWEPAVEDRGFGEVEEGSLLASLLPRLSPLERDILELRFLGNLSQADIATRVGYSQMHVSRLLTRALERLRAWAEIDDLAVPRASRAAVAQR